MGYIKVFSSELAQSNSSLQRSGERACEYFTVRNRNALVWKII